MFSDVVQIQITGLILQSDNRVELSQKALVMSRVFPAEDRRCLLVS